MTWMHKSKVVENLMNNSNIHVENGRHSPNWPGKQKKCWSLRLLCSRLSLQ